MALARAADNFKLKQVRLRVSGRTIWRKQGAAAAGPAPVRTATMKFKPLAIEWPSLESLASSDFCVDHRYYLEFCFLLNT